VTLPSLRFCRSHKLLAAFVVTGFLFCAAAPAVAEEGKVRRSTVQAADSVEVTGGVSGMAPAAEPEAACTKVRRRLWVEGEGWVVRRVGQCR
jgi:hypothetical protein